MQPPVAAKKKNDVIANIISNVVIPASPADISPRYPISLPMVLSFLISPVIADINPATIPHTPGISIVYS
jgi:hypothetical protein